MDRKLINPAIVSDIADAVRSKRMGAAAKAKMKVSGIADAIRGIRLGTPVAVTCRIGADGAWQRPAEWPDIEAAWSKEGKPDDVVYLTIDNTGRIDGSFLSLKVYPGDNAAWKVQIGYLDADGQFVSEAEHSVAYGAIFSNTSWERPYPVVRISAASGIYDFVFSGYTDADGRKYVARMNAVVEATGHIKKKSSNTVWATYWQERDSRVIGEVAPAALGSAWQGCYSLQSLDLSGWDTSKWAVTNMSSTWDSCCSLQSLDLSGWDTSKWAVTNMHYTWYSCCSLQSLDLSGWDTSKWAVTSMAQTWYCCYSLQSLDLSGWDTSKWAVTSMNNTWQSCYSLQSLDLSGLDLSKVTTWVTSSHYNWFGYRGDTKLVFGSNNEGKMHSSDAYVINLSFATGFSRDTFAAIAKALAPATGSQTINMGSEILNRLTAEEKAAFTSKGYTLA